MKKFLTAVSIGILAVVLGASPAHAANGKSTSNAGWIGQRTTAFTSAKARVTVPTVTCPANGTSVIQLNTTFSADAPGGDSAAADMEVNVQCANGHASYEAFVTEYDPTGSAQRTLGSVTGGDRLTVIVNYADQVLTVTGRNNTKNTTTAESVQTPGLAFHGASYLLLRVTGTATPLPTFTNIPFTELTIDGQPAQSQLDAGLSATDLYKNTTKLVHTGPFNSTGMGFHLAFLAAS